MKRRPQSAKLKTIFAMKPTEKNQIFQHVPGCISGVENQLMDFETTEELLEIPFVKRLGNDDDYSFQMSGDTLMTVKDDGTMWWVIGYINKPEEIDLPEWKHSESL